MKSFNPGLCFLVGSVFASFGGHCATSATVSTEALLGCERGGSKVVTIRATWGGSGVPPRAELFLNVLAADIAQAPADTQISVDLRKATPSMFHLLSACETAGPNPHCAPPQKVEWARFKAAAPWKEGQPLSGQVTFKSDGFPLPQSFSFNSVAVQVVGATKSCG